MVFQRLRCAIRQGRGSWDREVLPAGWRCRWTSNSAQKSKIHHPGPSPHSGKHFRSTVSLVLQCFIYIHFQYLSICSVGSVVFAKPILKHYGAVDRKHCIKVFLVSMVNDAPRPVPLLLGADSYCTRRGLCHVRVRLCVGRVRSV